MSGHFQALAENGHEVPTVRLVESGVTVVEAVNSLEEKYIRQDLFFTKTSPKTTFFVVSNNV